MPVASFRFRQRHYFDIAAIIFLLSLAAIQVFAAFDVASRHVSTALKAHYRRYHG